jgi:hypothetical protein
MTINLFTLAILLTIVALMSLPWAVIAWGRRLNRRAPDATPWSRWAWRWFILVPLVPAGAYLVIGTTVMKWGWPMTIWLGTAAVMHGLYVRKS